MNLRFQLTGSIPLLETQCYWVWSSHSETCSPGGRSNRPCSRCCYSYPTVVHSAWKRWDRTTPRLWWRCSMWSRWRKSSLWLGRYLWQYNKNIKLKTQDTRSCVLSDAWFWDSKSNSEVSKSNLWKTSSFSETMLLQREPFLTML